MAKTWPIVIRDPVHNLIPFEENDCDKLLFGLINTREFQRLRRIKQLGMSELVFPGANHSRFSHSLGTMHVARMMLDQLRRHIDIDDEKYVLTLVASLLHDIGHGPFSHAFERVTGQSHEIRTSEIIMDGSTDVHARLSEHDLELPRKLEQFFANEAEFRYLTQIVSSQLDADRFDYLLRDSYATGTNYGVFDLRWMLLHMGISDEHQSIVLNQKAQYVAEAYVYARYHMYRTVYFHKAVRAAEAMLRKTLERFKYFADSGKTVNLETVAPDAPKNAKKAFHGSMPLGEYLALDDYSLTELLKSFTGSSDKTLRILGGGLVDRRLLKGREVTHIVARRAEQLKRFYAAAEDEVKKKGFDPRYFFVLDTASDVPYKPYVPDPSEHAMQILVRTDDGVQELNRASERVHELTKEYTLVRYYYPAEVRDTVDTLFKEQIGGGKDG